MSDENKPAEEAPGSTEPEETAEDGTTPEQAAPDTHVPAVSAGIVRSSESGSIPSVVAPAQASPAQPEYDAAVDSPYEVGEWVKYNTPDNQNRPAMITDVDADTGLWSLAVFYKNHIDFIAQVEPETE